MSKGLYPIKIDDTVYMTPHKPPLLDMEVVVYGVVYHTKDDSEDKECFIKIGVTDDVKGRYTALQMDVRDKYKISFLGVGYERDRTDALYKEKNIIKKLDAHTTNHKFGGFTECVECNEKTIDFLANEFRLDVDNINDIIETNRVTEHTKVRSEANSSRLDDVSIKLLSNYHERRDILKQFESKVIKQYDEDQRKLRKDIWDAKEMDIQERKDRRSGVKNANAAKDDRRSCVYAVVVRSHNTEEVFIKIGVTINIKSRFSGIRSAVRDNYKTTIIGALITSNKIESVKKESSILNELTPHSPTFKFTGHTECVTCSRDNIEYISSIFNIPYKEMIDTIHRLKVDNLITNAEGNVLHYIEESLDHGFFSDGFSIGMNNKRVVGAKHKDKTVICSEWEDELFRDHENSSANGAFERLMNKETDKETQVESEVSGNVALFEGIGNNMFTYNIEDIFIDDGNWYVMIKEKNVLIDNVSRYYIGDEYIMGGSPWHYIMKWNKQKGSYDREKMLIVKSTYLRAVNKRNNNRVVPDGRFSCTEEFLQDFVR